MLRRVIADVAACRGRGRRAFRDCPRFFRLRRFRRSLGLGLAGAQLSILLQNPVKVTTSPVSAAGSRLEEAAVPLVNPDLTISLRVDTFGSSCAIIARLRPGTLDLAGVATPTAAGKVTKSDEFTGQVQRDHGHHTRPPFSEAEMGRFPDSGCFWWIVTS
jgi:hypothetical protein